MCILYEYTYVQGRSQALPPPQELQRIILKTRLLQIAAFCLYRGKTRLFKKTCYEKKIKKIQETKKPFFVWWFVNLRLMPFSPAAIVNNAHKNLKRTPLIIALP